MERAQDLVNEVREVQGTIELILRDTLTDYRGRELSREKSRLRKDIIILVLILSLVGSFFYYQWSLGKVISNFEFETTIEVAAEKENSIVAGGGSIINGGKGQDNEKNEA